ncbi:MAG: DNA alkylation repair protein [Chloroflexota bacterium]|nr:DNA alkylation repair protein [Chloroflexota bacterium]
MMVDVASERELLIAQLVAQGDPKRAANEKQYLKSNLNFHGVTTPKLHAMSKAWLKAHKGVAADDVVALAGALWASDWHEERTLAVFLLEDTATKLTPIYLPLIERMLHEVNTWAHLDEIAIHVVGPLLRRYPAVRDDLLRWATSPNFWVRRTAILAQNGLFRRSEGDFALFEQIAAPMLDEGKDWSKDERFFIRKATGWALRELASRKPELVVDFVQRHRAKLSGLTYREATRRLPPEWAGRLGDPL